MILEIDTGSGFVPVACLISFSINEESETLGTTTRDNFSWRTGVATFQSLSINLSGVIPRDSSFKYQNLIELKRAGTEFTWRVDDDEGRGLISELNLESPAGADVSFSGSIRLTGEPSLPADPPIVNAGVDQTIISPDTDAVLIGSVQNPGGTPITYLWTQISGPSTAFFVGETTLACTVSNLINGGTYVFRLTATNGAGSNFDEVNVFKTIPITASISAPSVSPVEPDIGASVQFTVTYTNADTITLLSSDITFTQVGNPAAGSVIVQGAGNTERLITLFNITGDGLLYVNIPIGTATNASGGVANAAQSPPLEVQPPAPSGYSIEFASDPINNNTPDVNILNIDTDWTYQYVITSSGGGSPIVSPQPNPNFIQEPNQLINPDVSSLPNGTLTIKLFVFNGNTPGVDNPAEDTSTKNT